MARLHFQSVSFIFALIAMLALVQPVQGQTQADPIRDSAQAAEQWLKILDDGKFQDSWDRASMTLRLTVPKRNWIALMENIKKPYGTVQSRKIIDQRPAKNPKDLPKGDYMVLVFEASFANKKTAHELVTLVQESDGRWRVLTYQIQ